ncbi:DUF262 domain-containing protein [Demequina rhizosphaerae]|uniref:DUF262 domain-containing protein n=1 Tax=Demequina rhizosphaerae TaxID=1638985 RepID=UPI000780701B|nr:DUF262 domain-containing protein [Demequina rhizosphaerae]
MKGFSTTYGGIFRSVDDRPYVASIEIPIIQRDYAQGREDEATATIRRDFLDVLLRAVTTDASIDLDFIYGEVTDGVLKPLDGQQRLTTLFLLHWYIASRAGKLDPHAAWSQFRYSTRLSAEYFCYELVNHAWPHEDEDPVDWITDQPWYLFPWRTDPTIQSMLVMIAAIHRGLSADHLDFGALWARLMSDEQPAISFLFLPIDDMESGDDLYIKMNSRGKPLTEFEIFKARLEKVLQGSGRRGLLSEKLDREWSDLLWHYEGGNHLVDEEFMNYLAFIVDVCEWRTGTTRTAGSLLDRARRVFVEHDDADTHLDLLFFAFDTWVGEDPSEDVPARVFAEMFRVGEGPTSAVRLFESQDPNLFAACLERYGTKQFSLAETILLYAVIVFRQSPPEGAAGTLERRLRSLRNIAESAPDDVRNEHMPDLIAATTTLMTAPEGAHLDGLKRFNQARVDDEKRKYALLVEDPEAATAVHALEDHDLLRGRLFAFPLDAAFLKAHCATFHAVTADDVLPQLAPALLTKGDYSRRLGTTRRQLGVPGERRGRGSWREVLTSGSRESREAMRIAVGNLLADVARHDGPTPDALDQIVREWLTERREANLYDWLYYFVRYPVMLAAPKGVYIGDYDAASGGYRYRVDMMNGADYRSAFKDPYLLAVWNEIDDPARVGKPEFRSWDYTGDERAMRFTATGAGLRSHDNGFEILLPTDPAIQAMARSALAAFALDSTNVIHVAKRTSDGLDAEDRVQTGAAVVHALLEFGL